MITDLPQSIPVPEDASPDLVAAVGRYHGLSEEFEAVEGETAAARAVLANPRGHRTAAVGEAHAIVAGAAAKCREIEIATREAFDRLCSAMVDHETRIVPSLCREFNRQIERVAGLLKAAGIPDGLAERLARDESQDPTLRAAYVRWQTTDGRGWRDRRRENQKAWQRLTHAAGAPLRRMPSNHAGPVTREALAGCRSGSDVEAVALSSERE